MQLKSPKIISNINILKPLVESVRQKNMSVVFTNGCFDIIHSGHIHILQQAKAKGDILIVGLNSDSSIKSFKSPNRPICPQEDRAFVLASLSCVDYVIIFDECTPERLIVEISPDVLVKGKDYEGKFISGADYMLENGKKIELVDLINGKSTSAIIERIKKISC
jgi:D-beta-D-heptose 7-phosphate kinase/D-beta-D-heptose 1-phosphate adenosyltransferase